ncbi:hypothetical protein ABW19_dt0203062 [Dactylella cylindrospora]|nr:hypothetical protein ABW19_dt0203062 [Dactylella cylindrospora]
MSEKERANILYAVTVIESLGLGSMDWPEASTSSSNSIISSRNESPTDSRSTSNTRGIDEISNVHDISVKPTEYPLPGDLEKEYTIYAKEFIKTNLKWASDHQPEGFTEIMREADKKREFIMNQYGLDPTDLKKLTILALYDFVVLCDDSWSMVSNHNCEKEDRVNPLKDLLIKIAELAALIVPVGISVRFLNYPHDCRGEWDYVIKKEAIEKQLKCLNWFGVTKLGGRLKEKVIEPMVIQKMKRGDFKKPLIIVTITDGVPRGEPRDTFKNVVMECKMSEEIEKYGEAAVVFVLARIGSDQAAGEFLYDLKRNKDLKEWVYCPEQRLDQNTAVMRRARIAGEAQSKDDYVKMVSPSILLI